MERQYAEREARKSRSKHIIAKRGARAKRGLGRHGNAVTREANQR